METHHRYQRGDFYGQAGRYILAGSDDGRFFCWDKESSNLMKMMTAWGLRD
ncbi:WD and tetratricopeptide repeats protein 1like [Caligus rogercresseyi]|uniref:WD and tetratricopeptide repeats protein 1like n=1 Tax=Caligus rogercresseyi TaxID=217165 RepID=A0A7T8JSZ2_CALRO|nr:WD and tetratricopeptide repeats protein 1like [Caligus rogercresseyi]